MSTNDSYGAWEPELLNSKITTVSSHLSWVESETMVTKSLFEQIQQTVQRLEWELSAAKTEIMILKTQSGGLSYGSREDMLKDLESAALERAARAAHTSTGVEHYNGSGEMLCVCGEAWNEKTLCPEYQRLVNQ